MNKEKVQLYAEQLERLLDRDMEEELLTDEEFNAVNMILLHLDRIGDYSINETYLVKGDNQNSE